MDDLTQASIEKLEWVHLGETDAFRLVSGEHEIATLEWEKGTETVARARSIAGEWTLKRRGFLNPALTVRDAATERELAVLHVRWRDSMLQLASGLSFRWIDSGFWTPRWKFTDSHGHELVKFEPRQGHGRQLGRGVVSCAPEVHADSDLLMLLVVGWYFVVLVWAEQEGESIGAFVTTMAGR